MEAQHAWCAGRGYLEVVTESKNRWRAMLILNLKAGFDIVDTYTDDHGEPKVILRKKLPRGGSRAEP